MSDITIALGPNGTFELFIPGGESGHHVRVPATTEGLGIIRRVLSARREDLRPTLGKPSSPTQSMVDAWLKSDPEKRPAVDVDLLALGL